MKTYASFTGSHKPGNKQRLGVSHYAISPEVGLRTDSSPTEQRPALSHSSNDAGLFTDRGLDPHPQAWKIHSPLTVVPS